MSDKTLLIAMFIAVFSVFFFARIQTPLVHDDTGAVRSVAYYNAQKAEFTTQSMLSMMREFGNNPRLISLTVHRLGATYFANGNPPWIWYLFSSSLIALTFISVYLLSHAVIKNRAFSFFSTLLVIFSPAQVSTSWVTFAGIQSLVYLLLSFGLYAYIKFCDETTQNRKVHLFSLISILFLAPLVREVAIVLPVFMLISQAIDRNYFRPLNILLIIAVLHALYPTAALSLLLEVPMQNIFQSHTITGAVSSGGGSSIFIYYFWLLTPICLIGAILLLFPLSIKFGLPDYLRKPTLPIKMFVFFLMLSLPFTRVFALPMHLGYSLIPLSIVIGNVYSLAWKKWNQAVFRYALSAVLVTICLAQIMNLYASASTVYSINDGFLKVAKQLKQNVPDGSLIISNTSALRDINQIAGWRYMFAFTNWTEAYFSPLVTSPVTTDELERIINAPPNDKPVFVLEADFLYPPHQYAFHSNRIVRNQEIELEKIGETVIVDARYPLIDPIKWLTPRNYHIFPGTPDYLTEFYYGPAIDGMPLMGESKVSYTIYKITGNKVAGLFHGYRLTNYKGKYYATRGGIFSVGEQLLTLTPSPEAFSGDTLADVQQQILDSPPKGIAALEMNDNLARDAIAVALHKNEDLPASNVNDGTDRPMAAVGGEPIVGVTLSFEKPVTIRKISLVTFGDPQHAKDISVLVGDKANFDQLVIIPSRLTGEQNFHNKVTLPNSPSGSIITLELDTKSKYWKPWPVFGVTSLPDYEKNYFEHNRKSGSFYLVEIGMYEKLDHN